MNANIGGERRLFGGNSDEWNSRARPRVGIVFVVADHLFGEQRNVVDRTREQPDVIECARKRDARWREISPWVGLKPTTPQYAAGRIVEPLVWLPIASGTMLAPTAAADPLEEPPGVCSGLCGLRVLPGEK